MTAVAYQVLAIINLAWPRSLVYDLTGHTWWLQWSAPLFIGGTLIIGYLGVTAPLLLHRFRGARGQASAATAAGTDEHGKRLFSLGKWAIPVNIVAVGYQVIAIVNLAWPRKSVYDLTGHTWWLQWSAVLFIAITLAVGYLVHLRLRGGKVHIPHAWHHHPAAEPAVAAALAEPEGA